MKYGKNVLVQNLKIFCTPPLTSVGDVFCCMQHKTSIDPILPSPRWQCSKSIFSQSIDGSDSFSILVQSGVSITKSCHTDRWNSTFYKDPNCDKIGRKLREVVTSYIQEPICHTFQKRSLFISTKFDEVRSYYTLLLATFTQYSSLSEIVSWGKTTWLDTNVDIFRTDNATETKDFLCPPSKATKKKILNFFIDVLF